MKTESHETKPKVRTIIKFTSIETITALIEYAQKQGYIFDCQPGDMFIWYPDRHNRDEDVLKIGLDKDGTKAGITKPNP